MNFSLGTVQFGLNYGVTNHNGMVKKSEVFSMIELFRSFGFKRFDTASAYGKSERVLSEFLKEEDIVTTKIPPKNMDFSLPIWINKNLKISLKNLNRNCVDTLLLHKSSDLLNEDGSELNLLIKQLKEQRTIKNFGISVYETEELSRAIKIVTCDVIQLPFNIIDRRFLEEGWFDKLVQMGIKIEVRSVFLQGLLLMQPNTLPRSLNKWQYIWTKFEKWQRANNNCSALSACLGFVTSFPQVDSFVIGAQNRKQLAEIILGLEGKRSLKFPNLACDDVNLILPQNWSL